MVEPSIWPDEAYIADVANNIAREGRAGTDLWGETIIGIRKSIYWYPPVFTTTLAFWFKIFGFSILHQRLLSVILGGGTLLVIYLLSQKILTEVSLKKKFFGFFLILFLIIDNSFLKASKMGRPEMMVIFLGFLALYLYQLAEKSQHKKLLYIITGLILVLTMLTHLIGIFFFLIILGQMVFIRKDKLFYFMIIGFVPLLFAWLINILPEYNIFLEQFSLQQSFRGDVPSFMESVFHFYSQDLKINYFLYFILSLACASLLLRKRLLRYLFLLLGLFISWLIGFQGKLEWYSVYIAIFLYVLSFVIINNTSKIFSVSLSFLLLILFLVNLKIYFNSFNLYQDKKDAYFIFGQEVASKIPEKSTIYLSTTPDLYFIFKGRNHLYEFPGVQPKEKEYIGLLNSSDYIVINFHLERLFVGDLLDRYIKLNALKEYSVSAGNLYNSQIIELVPKNMRRLPD